MQSFWPVMRASRSPGLPLFAWWLCALLLAGSWLASEIASAGALTVAPDLARTSLHDYAEILEDPTGALGLEQIRTDETGRFRHPKRPSFDFGYSESTWWVRFRLKNPSAVPVELLLEAGIPQIDEIDLYSPNDHGAYARQRLGDTVPYELRPLPHRRAVFPLRIPARETATYYLRVRTTSAVSLPLHVSAEKPFFAYLHDNVWWLGAFYGALIALIAYNLLLYWATRERSYVWYVASTAFVVLYFASVDGIGARLWPGPSHWQTVAVPFFVGLVVFTIGQFTRHYLELTHDSPHSNRSLQVISGLGLTASVGALFFGPPIVSLLSTLTAVLLVLVIVPIAVLRLRAGFEPARAFVIGWSLLLVCALFALLATIGVLPYLGLGLFALKLGLLSERFFSALALADRINTLTEVGVELRRQALVAQAETQAEAAERRRAELALRDSEERLRQAQKMEAVGRFAGGIAHDFNNLLSPILGYVDLALMDLPTGSPLHSDLLSVRQAAERSSALTRQLLAVSRQQLLELHVINVNDVLASFKDVLRRLVREDIVIELLLAADLASIRADPSQLHQIVMNLALNAADAMPSGGRLRIATENVVLEANAPTHTEIPPGRYVAVKVSDTGTGMPPDLLPRIFDPFFTTKEGGQGTGLGLATVLGIASQHGGSVSVESAVAHGTTFRVFLPRIDEAPERSETIASATRAQRGSETVLVAEDDTMVRELTVDILRRQGYQVLAPLNTEQAIKMANIHDGPIHLLVTDVIMPGMNGRTLYEALKHSRPEMKVLFMSGYAHDVIAGHVRAGPGAPFLQKPFSVQSLAEKVRRALDGAQ